MEEKIEKIHQLEAEAEELQERQDQIEQELEMLWASLGEQ